MLASLHVSSTDMWGGGGEWRGEEVETPPAPPTPTSESMKQQIPSQVSVLQLYITSSSGEGRRSKEPTLRNTTRC